jgi:hypothetical protein
MTPPPARLKTLLERKAAGNTAPDGCRALRLIEEAEPIDQVSVMIGRSYGRDCPVSRFSSQISSIAMLLITGYPLGAECRTARKE